MNVISTELQPGDTLGRYEILMPVAKGGMAAVWAARLVGTRGFQKVVAIKTILPALTDDPDFEAMLLDEARLAARIRHPHAVEIVDLGEEGEWLYLVMEWVNGETLFTLNKRAKERGGIPLPILLRILSSACAGLQAAHEVCDDEGKHVGLVHRDVSPQNIMVSFDGIVKIVDFGVAKAAGRLHQTNVGGIMKGKVPYLSPEQLDGQKLDRRSDIFSLGIIAYVMATGRHPFKGTDDSRTMENIATRAAVPLRELVADMSPALEAIVLRALEKDPNRRFSDCAEMQRAIDDALRDLGTSVTDGDVAAYVRDLFGDLIEGQRVALAKAIERADARASSAPPVARKRATGRAGAPLSATAEGILPVILDESPASANAEPASPPAEASRPIPLAASGRKRRSLTPIIVLALAVLIAFTLMAVRYAYMSKNMLPGLSHMQAEAER